LSIGIDFGIGIDQNSWYRTGIVSNPKKLVSAHHYLQINFGNRSVRFGNYSEIASRLNSNGQRLKKNIVKKNDKYSKTTKSQDSRIKTLFAEIFNFKSYFCKLCMVTVNDIVGKLLKAKYK
jgi:hypothetical protein